MMILLLFILGAVAGSVANALVYRLPRGISWFSGHSFCPKCKHNLSFWDLVPIASYLMLRGKCRYCRSPIAKRYLWVELLIGVGFVLIFNFQFSIFNLGIFWIMTVIAVMDWETQLVSDLMVFLWFILVLIEKFSIFNFQFSINNLIFNFSNPFFGLLIGLVSIGGIWLITKKKAMGSGDIGIAGVTGLWLGWPKILTGLWIAFVMGGVFGAYLLITKKASMKTAVPFGPFLILGGWIAYTLNYGIF